MRDDWRYLRIPLDEWHAMSGQERGRLAMHTFAEHRDGIFARVRGEHPEWPEADVIYHALWDLYEGDIDPEFLRGAAEHIAHQAQHQQPVRATFGGKPERGFAVKNPWIGLPREAPFVLPSDRAIVEEHNSRARREHVLVIDQIPEPFLGNPQAPVVLLNLNPGAGLEQADAQQSVLPQTTLGEAALQNLRHDPTMPYPFWTLDPAFSGFPGFKWWSSKLRALVSEFGAQHVSHRLFCLEFFPYRSNRFRKTPFMPSQEYGVSLAKAALKRRAVIVIMRGRSHWEGCVKELSQYRRCFGIRSPQAASISSKNCPEGWSQIVEAVGSA